MFNTKVMMKTAPVRVSLDDHAQIRQWAISKGLTVQDTVHALVNGAKSIQYQRQYERSLEKCSKKKVSYIG